MHMRKMSHKLILFDSNAIDKTHLCSRNRESQQWMTINITLFQSNLAHDSTDIRHPQPTLGVERMHRMLAISVWKHAH